MARTVLFFGDSNTRGFGVGRQARFATLLESELAADQPGEWEFRVSSCASDLGLIRSRLPAAILKHQPELLVCHCPGGPLVPMIDYPAWVRGPQRIYRHVLTWLESLYRSADLRRGLHAGRSERDVLYEGLYLSDAHRWKPSSAPILTDLRRVIVRRFPTTRVITLDKYLDRLGQLYDLIRATRPMTVAFFGLFPLRPDYYPGYNARVGEWTPAIAQRLRQLPGPPQYIDTSPLLGVPGNALLLRDGTHLSATGHRHVAKLVAPQLRSIMESLARGPQPHAADGP